MISPNKKHIEIKLQNALASNPLLILLFLFLEGGDWMMEEFGGFYKIIWYVHYTKGGKREIEGNWGATGSATKFPRSSQPATKRNSFNRGLEKWNGDKKNLLLSPLCSATIPVGRTVQWPSSIQTQHCPFLFFLHLLHLVSSIALSLSQKWFSFLPLPLLCLLLSTKPTGAAPEDPSENWARESRGKLPWNTGCWP